MSNRTIEQADLAAELRISHLAQIEALTKPGLSDKERLELFADAAGFDKAHKISLMISVFPNYSVSRNAWGYGIFEKSLFAYLPGCMCPVQECLPGVPQDMVPNDWEPTVAMLERFSEIQIERRCGV